MNKETLKIIAKAGFSVMALRLIIDLFSIHPFSGFVGQIVSLFIDAAPAALCIYMLHKENIPLNPRLSLLSGVISAIFYWIGVSILIGLQYYIAIQADQLDYFTNFFTRLLQEYIIPLPPNLTGYIILVVISLLINAFIAYMEFLTLNKSKES